MNKLRGLGALRDGIATERIASADLYPRTLSGCLRARLFDERDLAAVTSPDFPGERLIVRRNPLLAEERARKREDLLRRTERDLGALQKATERKRNPLRGEAKIGARFGEIRNKHKTAKQFYFKITGDRFSYSRNQDDISQEVRLDGFDLIRTCVSGEKLGDAHTVRTYKSLSQVERALWIWWGSVCMALKKP